MQTPPKPILEAYNNDQAATCVLLCQQWLRVHPNDLSVIHDYATMLYQMARFDEAIAVYIDALERFPDGRWGIYNQLGHLHRYRGAFPDAERAYQQAIDTDPEEAGSYISLGAVQARQGKLTEAEKTHRMATECPKGCIYEAYHNLGLVLRGQGRLADAKTCFEKAILEKAIKIDQNYEDAIEALNDVTTAMEMDGGAA